MESVFSSAHIIFVRVSESLIPDYLEMVNDFERVQRFIGERTAPYTAEQETRWVHKKLEEHAVVFSMLDRDRGSFIGNIELMDVADGAGELGIAITAKMQERGYGTEAVAALTQYGFHQLDLYRIFLRTDPANARAIHVYEKCGFREYARTEKHVCMELIRK